MQVPQMYLVPIHFRDTLNLKFFLDQFQSFIAFAATATFLVYPQNPWNLQFSFANVDVHVTWSLVDPWGPLTPLWESLPKSKEFWSRCLSDSSSFHLLKWHTIQVIQRYNNPLYYVNQM